MKRAPTLLIVILLFAVMSAFAYAQGNRTVGTITEEAQQVAISLPSEASVAVVQISGTYSGTNQFEAAPANGLFVSVNCSPVPTGTAVTSTTSTGTWQCGVAGMEKFRVRNSAYTSGRAVVVAAGSSGAPKADIAVGDVSLSTEALELAIADTNAILGETDDLPAETFESTASMIALMKAMGLTLEAMNTALESINMTGEVEVTNLSPDVPEANYNTVTASNGTTDVALVSGVTNYSIVIESISVVNTDDAAGHVIKLCDGACSTDNFYPIPAPMAAESDVSGAVHSLQFSGTAGQGINFACAGACSTDVLVGVTYRLVYREPEE